MATDGTGRRQQLLLALLVVALAGVLWYQFAPQTANVGPSASDRSGATRSPSGPQQVTAPDVHIASLSAERPKPGREDRDLFRYRPRTPPPAVRPVAPPPPPPRPIGPPPPPRVPPITLKYLGYLETGAGEKIASLTDGRGVPIQAKEGSEILGQYKIWRVSPDSIDISYRDGTGRTTIRQGP
jgi:hypothetical protein